MEEDLKKLDELFDSILDEIIHPEKAGTYRNPFIEKKVSPIAELAEAITVILVKISDDSMKAVATVMSKGINHKPFSADDIKRVASTNGVFYGIDEDAVKDMADRQLINTDVVIASGTPALDGVDGEVHLKFDLKDGDEVQNITKDTEIFHIVSPKQGRSGTDVRGRVLTPRTGKSADYIIGEGLYKKGTRVYAEKNGKLILRDGVYSVVNELVLDKNIDQASGIIGYDGTIIINGNVSGRGIVRASGSVIVHGVVSSSVIEAVQSITVDGRVTDASLSTTEGDISGTEFIDSTIVSGGGLKAASLQNCTVKCVTGIECMEGFGKIAGGEVFCAGSINCLTVGTREHSETHITMGDCNEYNDEIKSLEGQVARLDKEIAKINEQVNDIREKEKSGTASLEEKSFLDAAIRIRAQKVNDKTPLTERIRKLNGIIGIASKATLRAKTMIYGGAILKIGGKTQILNSDRSHATVRFNGSNIVIT